jgi:hypothetical protein
MPKGKRALATHPRKGEAVHLEQEEYMAEIDDDDPTPTQEKAGRPGHGRRRRRMHDTAARIKATARSNSYKLRRLVKVLETLIAVSYLPGGSLPLMEQVLVEGLKETARTLAIYEDDVALGGACNLCRMTLYSNLHGTLEEVDKNHVAYTFSPGQRMVLKGLQHLLTTVWITI